MPVATVACWALKGACILKLFRIDTGPFGPFGRDQDHLMKWVWVHLFDPYQDLFVCELTSAQKVWTSVGNKPGAQAVLVWIYH